MTGALGVSVDLEAARDQLRDPGGGYYPLRGYLDPEHCDRFREWWSRAVDQHPIYHARIANEAMHDYVQPASHDSVARILRLYQFPHNRREPDLDAFLDSSLALRDAIEEPWLANPDYLRTHAELVNYSLVTRYRPGTGEQPRHRDYEGVVAFPLLQFLVLLSEPETDYRGGEFTLFTRSGEEVRMLADLGLGKGDALVFDKSLDHAVARTLAPSGAGPGRWSLLVGARARRDGAVRDRLKRWLFHPRVTPVTLPLQALWRRTGLPGLHRWG